MLLPDPHERDAVKRVAEFRKVVENYAMYLQDADRIHCFEEWAALRGLKTTVQ
jgi:hypothetical protein